MSQNASIYLLEKRESYILLYIGEFTFMERMIPKSTKVKVEFIKGLNFGDIFVILFALIILALAWTSGFSTVTKLVLTGVTGLVFWYSFYEF